MRVPSGAGDNGERLVAPAEAAQHGAAGPAPRMSTPEAAAVLGVTPSVLMRWEQRFGFAASPDMVGRHRTFSIAQLILLGQAVRGRECGPGPRPRPEGRRVPSS